MWRCPLCRSALRESVGEMQGASLRCSQGHCYDVAQEGYVNLLLANRKRSQDPGDSRDMIAARARVHDADIYRPLAAALQEQLCALCPQQDLHDDPIRMLDLGCGEGYYGAAIAQVLPGARLLGIDIAKPAVRLAAKRWPCGEFAVASAFDIPLPDSSLDVVLSVFAPLDEQEVARLLVPGGIYLKVIPASRHLWELRCLLYDQPEPHQVEAFPLNGFQSLSVTAVDYSVDLNGDLLRDVVAMTPYAHKGSRSGHDKLDSLDALTLQMSFNVSVHRLGQRL